MKPLTQRQHYAGEDQRFPLPSHGPAQQFPGESVVVVLGVMYPSVLPQPAEASTHLDPAIPPPGLDTGRQSMDVIFIDPLSKGHGDDVFLPLKCRRKYKGAGYVDRTDAQKAVARDLALLSLRKRG